MPEDRNLNWHISAFVGLTAIFMGCAYNAPGSMIQRSSSPVKPPTSTRQQALPEYRLGFGDVVEFKFFINSEFDETVTVRPDGRISLMKVGEIYVNGMTPSKLDSLVTASYREFVLDPDITVIVRQFQGNQVYVLGEVTAPGGYIVQRDMTVLQALASAGGVTNMAKLGSVIILRRGHNKEPVAFKVDLGRSVKAKSRADIATNDMQIQPQDIVYVPKTFVANVANFMRQVYEGVLPPLDLYLRTALFYN